MRKTSVSSGGADDVEDAVRGRTLKRQRSVPGMHPQRVTNPKKPGHAHLHVNNMGHAGLIVCRHQGACELVAVDLEVPGMVEQAGPAPWDLPWIARALSVDCHNHQ